MLRQILLKNHLKETIFISFVMILGIHTHTNAQVNLSGKPGLMYTPSAVKTEDGLFSFGYNYNPMHYALRGRDKNPERILYANIAIFSRLEVNITFLQMINSSRRKVREALGDRQLDVRYLILKEKKNRPSVAVVLTTPFTIDGAMLTHVLVATKNFKLSKDLRLEASAGYGSPWYLYRDETNLKNSNTFANFKWQEKSKDQYKNHYLQGPFGGAILHFRNYAGIMAEYDSQHINVGAYAKLFKRWTIQAGLINGDKVTFGTSYAIPLLKPTKRLKQQSDAENR